MFVEKKNWSDVQTAAERCNVVLSPVVRRLHSGQEEDCVCISSGLEVNFLFFFVTWLLSLFWLFLCSVFLISSSSCSTSAIVRDLHEIRAA